MAEYYSIVWTDCSLCAQLLKDVLVASEFWRLLIRLLQTFGYRFLYGRKFSTYLGKYQGMRLLDHTVEVCLILKGTAKLPSKMAASLCIPNNNELDILSVCILTRIRCCQCFGFSAIPIDV